MPDVIAQDPIAQARARAARWPHLYRHEAALIAELDHVADRLAAAERQIDHWCERANAAEASESRQRQRVETLSEVLRRIADGAESNPPHEVAEVARAALEETDQ